MTVEGFLIKQQVWMSFVLWKTCFVPFARGYWENEHKERLNELKELEQEK